MKQSEDYRKAVEALQESEDRFRTLADTAPVLIWMAGADTLRNFFNKTWLDFTGRTSEQEMGNGWVEGIHPDDLHRGVRTYLESFEARRRFRMEYRLRQVDGTYAWLLDTGVPRFTPSGSFIGFIGSCIDITDRKLAEDALVRHSEELERKNSELERFAYVSSHDLQEPLRMISNYTQLLARRYEGKLDSDADQYIAYAVEGANRIRELIDDLLEYNHSAKTQNIQRFNMRTVVDQAIHTMPQGRLSGVRIEIDGLPEIVGDGEQLCKVFHHLIDNAVKYRSEEPPLIIIRATRTEEEWRFTVADNGIGIDRRYHTKIFDIFQRLHSRAAYPGTGVGLAIARRIVERHNGRMWVESDLGAGASFHFTLPVAA